MTDATTLVSRIRANSRDALATEAAEAIERMQGHLEGECHCPCCDQVRVCLEVCEFSEDFPADHQKMIEAREAYWGKS